MAGAFWNTAGASSWQMTLRRTSHSSCGRGWRKCSCDVETRDKRLEAAVSRLVSRVSCLDIEGSMKTYQYMWRMIRFRPWLYLADGVLWTAIHVAPVLPGLAARELLDTLSGHAQLGLSVWALIGLLMAIALGRVMLVLGGALADIPHRFSMSALLRRNLLERILELPGARPLPESTGEALSRFRDDAEQAEDAISWTLDPIGTAAFAIVAVIILLTINARITLLVFLPLAGLVAIAHMAATR